MTAAQSTAAELAWYAAHGCEHAHCPRGCEKPQPFLHAGVLYCGRCWVGEGLLSEMLPCTPEVCD